MNRHLRTVRWRIFFISGSFLEITLFFRTGALGIFVKRNSQTKFLHLTGVSIVLRSNWDSSLKAYKTHSKWNMVSLYIPNMEVHSKCFQSTEELEEVFIKVFQSDLWTKSVFKDLYNSRSPLKISTARGLFKDISYFKNFLKLFYGHKSFLKLYMGQKCF